ncbi:hypothetical protein [uncultured Campylobacter sp.]|uniref:hypothetical protein n=1 Tax=uncultured Campylobacter sp. TaxID=218934 RepID=UPI0026186C1F|nr:hypothetical protein [uncultured Campylobacter sp.]
MLCILQNSINYADLKFASFCFVKRMEFCRHDASGLQNSGMYVNFKNSESCGALNYINLGVKILLI